MERAADNLKALESITGITAAMINYSKINKILKKVTGLKKRIPPEAEERYRFTERANTLLEKWQPLLDADPEAGQAGVSPFTHPSRSSRS